METSSQLNPNLLNSRWKARGRKQNISSQNGVGCSIVDLVWSRGDGKASEGS